jgi:hypothetical protein
MKKYTAFILAGLIIALLLCGCSNNEEKATEVTEDFIAALEDNSIDDLEECYNPDSRKSPDMLTEFRTELSQYDDVGFVLQEVKNCEIDGKKGKITSDYTLNIGLKIKVDCTFSFDVIKVDGEWYLDSDPKINSSKKHKNNALSNAETVELAVKECQADIAARNNEVYNNNRTYIDLDGVTQTVPDAYREHSEITIYDVVGVKDIYEAVAPIVYDGKIYEPYWYFMLDECKFLSFDHEVLSPDNNYIDEYWFDVSYELTKKGIPRKDIYIDDLL